MTLIGVPPWNITHFRVPIDHTYCQTFQGPRMGPRRDRSCVWRASCVLTEEIQGLLCRLPTPVTSINPSTIMMN